MTKAIYTPNRDISAYTIHEASLVKMPLKYRTPEEMTPDMNIVKMMMIDEPEILDAAIARLPQTFRDKYTTVKSAPYYFEVLNKEASKGAALRISHSTLVLIKMKSWLSEITRTTYP